MPIKVNIVAGMIDAMKTPCFSYVCKNVLIETNAGIAITTTTFIFFFFVFFFQTGPATTVTNFPTNLAITWRASFSETPYMRFDSVSM